MDEGTRTGGQAVGARAADGDRSPEEIRSDIAQTREELGETVEALAAKTDVKAHAQARVEEVKAEVKSNPQKPLMIAGGIVAAIVFLGVIRKRRRKGY